MEEEQADWTPTAEEWLVMTKCNSAARMLYPYSSQSQEAWAVRAFRKWRTDGVLPEQLRDKQSPGIKNLYARRPPKFQ